MKRNQFSNLDRPRFATFNEIGDHIEGVIVNEPQWIEDPLNSERQMLKIVLQSDSGVYWQLNARTQMPTAIDDALEAAEVDEIVAGGRLAVELAEFKSTTKIYKATYTPPDDHPLF
jgi:hypothetical protein